MSVYPNLKGVATKNLVEKVDAGKYKADYINWARTMQLLHEHAPGWLPELVQTAEGGYVHRGGVGGFLLIRFVHQDGSATPGFPQAIMDNRNAAIPVDKITARDITDTHRRGACMAAALAFGLASELWAKMPLESGYADPAPGQSTAKAPASEPVREREPGAEHITPEQLSEIGELVPALATLRGTTVEQVTAALQNDVGTIAELDQAAAEALLDKLRRWKTNLEASAGEQAAGAGPSGSEAPDAPAEQSTFEEMAQRAQAAEKAKKKRAA